MHQVESNPQGRFKSWLRILFGITAVVVGIVVIVVIVSTVLYQARASKVADAVRASFPDFCTDGHILAEASWIDGLPYGRYWGIRCDTVPKRTLYTGYSTVVDTDQCTTKYPEIGTVGVYYYEMQALNSSNGKKMAVCP